MKKSYDLTLTPCQYFKHFQIWSLDDRLKFSQRRNIFCHLKRIISFKTRMKKATSNNLWENTLSGNDYEQKPMKGPKPLFKQIIILNIILLAHKHSPKYVATFANFRTFEKNYTASLQWCIRWAGVLLSHEYIDTLKSQLKFLKSMLKQLSNHNV